MTVEAVNSVIQAAPVVRASAEQTSTAATSGNPSQVQKVAEAPYVSPYLTVDVQTDTTVIEIRDATTGKVLQQIPSQTSLDAKRFQSQTVPAPQASEQQQPEQQQAIPVAAPAAQQNNAPAPAQTQATAQQVAAFAAASQSGNTNAGNVSLFA